MSSQVIVIHQGCEWHFEQPLKTVVAYRIEEVLSSLYTVEKWVKSGKYAVGWVAYEAGPAFDKAFPRREETIPELPLVWFAIFDTPKQFPLEFHNTQNDITTEKWLSQISQEEYTQVLKNIHENISCGNVYQVNFTFPLLNKLDGNLTPLFYRLCFAQGTGYFVYIKTDDFSVLSISPELFFHYSNGKVVLKPMKGTRPRGKWHEEDIQNMNELQNDPKERAENLMIVDLIRNDIGKVAVFGSVKVPYLFTCEPYRTVWQMTSTIVANTEKSWVDVLRAMFPSGSVTGAPKIYAMKLIQQWEQFPRGVYCGTVGWITPQNEAVFNVAIRTLVHNQKTKTAFYYVGSGVVWDSNSDKEWEECLTKGAILENFPPPFNLIETTRVEKGEVFLLDYHLQRLEKNAYRFQFPVPISQLKEELLNHVRSISDSLYRLKIAVFPDGKFTFEKNTDIGSTKLRITLAKNPINPDNLFLYYKTSYRKVYEDARKEAPGFDDVLLWNNEQYITESTIANVVVRFGEKMYTPPLHCGLLPGTFRQYLLDNHVIEERAIAIKELGEADKIYLINSVRKWIEVELKTQ